MGQSAEDGVRSFSVGADAGDEGTDTATSRAKSSITSSPAAHSTTPRVGAASGALAQATSASSTEADLLSPTTPSAQTQAGNGNTAAAAPTLASGVGMQEMIDAIRATIEIAARQGIAQARIALQPEDLGHISIRLSQTSDGLLARVSAETPAAVQALAEGRAELHQSLSSLGVSLLRLDISSFGQSQAGGHQQRSAGDQAGQATAASSSSSNSEEADDATGPGAIEGAAPPMAIAGGELVDVLA